MIQVSKAKYIETFKRAFRKENIIQEGDKDTIVYTIDYVAAFKVTDARSPSPQYWINYTLVG